MATKPTTLPQWATTGTVTEPSAGKKALGWIAEKPPFAYMNWLLNLIYQWCAYVNDGIFTSGSGNAVTGISSGAGYGVNGIGYGSSSDGVHGYGGTGTAAGVSGQGGAGGGPGGSFTATAGPAVFIQGDATSPTTGAVRWATQDTQPSGPNNVGDMYITTAGVLKVCTVAGSPGTWVSVGSQT